MIQKKLHEVSDNRGTFLVNYLVFYNYSKLFFTIIKQGQNMLLENNEV